YICVCCFFFSSRRRHTRSKRDWSSDVCSSDLSQSPASVALDPTNGSFRRYSSQEVANMNSYSKLQSALLGEGKSAVDPAMQPLMSKPHPGRKYSEFPYQPQPHPESFKYPLNQSSAAAYLQQHQKAAKQHKHSMIHLGMHEHLMEVLPPLNE